METKIRIDETTTAIIEVVGDGPPEGQTSSLLGGVTNEVQLQDMIQKASKIADQIIKEFKAKGATEAAIELGFAVNVGNQWIMSAQGSVKVSVKFSIKD